MPNFDETGAQTIARKRARARKRLRNAEKNLVNLSAVAISGKCVASPPSGISALPLVFRHLAHFWRGGVAAAFEAETPLIGRSEYRVALSLTIADYLQRYFSKPFMKGLMWHGIPTFKTPCDLWTYQDILYRCRPDVVVEIGSHYGGSTQFIAEQFDALDHGEVLSVDISRAVFMASHPRITCLTGDCADPDLLAEITARVKGRTVMVIHDAEHDRVTVERDLSHYAPLVSIDQYLVVEDGVIDLFNPARYRLRDQAEGPLAAIDAFLASEDGRFVVDETCERFVITSNPKGFMRRIR